MKDIYDRLVEYSNNDYVPMHMPGHKRNTNLFSMENPYAFDITEIDGFDNLHNPETIILESMNRTAKMYGSKNTFYLVNGTSIGLLTAISSVTRRRDNVIVARNCHKSVYNAIYLNELDPVYVYPREVNIEGNNLGIYGKIEKQDIELILKQCEMENTHIAAVIITSPTYEGIVSDIRGIAEVVHSYKLPLIVDEAHGAHFNFSERFPASSLVQGADIVVQSIHKTLPAFTQTAIMHVNGTIVDVEKVKFYMDIYQSTSPSYILMAGIDRCMTILQNDSDNMFKLYIDRLDKLIDCINGLKYIKLLKVDDISKIVLYPDRTLCELNGKQLYDILLEEYHIQLEMASENYVIAMTSIGDTDEYYSRFFNALNKVDKFIAKQCDDTTKSKSIMSDLKYSELLEVTSAESNLIKAQLVCRPYDAINSDKLNVNIMESVGRVSAECICVYPPGIPVVNSGELITNEIIRVIQDSLNTGLHVLGISCQQKEAYNNTMDIDDNSSCYREVKILCLK